MAGESLDSGSPICWRVNTEEAARGVHATHDLHIFKPIVAGETYTTQACVVGLQAIKPGAAQTLKLVTCDSQGELVCTTWQTGISRGVEIAGDNTIEEPAPEVPEPDAAGVVSSFEVSVAEGAANVYTETARIFNPIHSDKAYAMAPATGYHPSWHCYAGVRNHRAGEWMFRWRF